MADNTLVESIHLALRTLKVLRTSVGCVFQCIAEGIKDFPSEENKERRFMIELQQSLSNVGIHFREFDAVCTSLNVSSNALSLGNCGHLIHDPIHEKSPIYLQLIQSYKWTDKVHEFASHAVAYLNQNSLKRSNINPGLMAKRVRKATPTSHNVATQLVDSVIANVDRLFPDMDVTCTRPYGNSAVLQITIGKTMKALIVLRSLIIEWAVIKGYNEDFFDEDGKLDFWSSSKYVIFQKVTEHANAAMLHFYSPLIPELAVRSFMTWLHSYCNLFVTPCHRCGNHLYDNIPPTWRDVRNLDAYHESCRP